MTASTSTVADTNTPGAPEDVVHDVEKTAFSDSEPPDGGFDAWLSVFGCFLVYFCTLG